MNSNIYKIGFFILLAANVAIISFIAMKPKRGSMRESMREKISNELGLSPEQKSAFMEMAKSHREKVHEIEKSEIELVKAYFESINNQDIAIDRESMTKEILFYKTQKLQSTYTHFEQVKEMLDDEQRVKFQAFMNRVIPMLTRENRRKMHRLR